MILPHPGHPVPSSMEALRAYFSPSDPYVPPRMAIMRKAICLQMPAVSEEWRGVPEGSPVGQVGTAHRVGTGHHYSGKERKDLEEEWGWRQNSESSFFFKKRNCYFIYMYVSMCACLGLCALRKWEYYWRQEDIRAPGMND